MELFGLRESIECDAAFVVAKKVELSPPLNHNVFGKCIKYTCTRDGEAEIKKELNPKESRLQNPITSMNLGDKIKSTAFYVLLRGFRPMKVKKVHFSGSHNAREFITNDYTFAEISKPYSVGSKIVVNLPSGYISPFNALTKSGNL